MVSKMRKFLLTLGLLFVLPASALAQFNSGAGGGAIYVAGSGITISGNTISLGDANLTYSSGALALGASASAAGSLTVYNATSGFSEWFSDAANVGAQRNATSAQAYRVYDSFTDASDKSWAAVVAGQTGGSEACAANTLCLGSWHVGTPGGGGSLTKLGVYVDGTLAGDYGSSSQGAWTFSGSDVSGAVHVKTAVSGSYVGAITMYASGLTAGQSTFFVIGEGASNYNSASVQFTYNGAGSTANVIGIDFYGQTTPAVFWSGAGVMTVSGLSGTGSRPACVTSSGAFEAGSLSGGLVTCP